MNSATYPSTVNFAVDNTASTKPMDRHLQFCTSISSLGLKKLVFMIGHSNLNETAVKLILKSPQNFWANARSGFFDA